MVLYEKACDIDFEGLGLLEHTLHQAAPHPTGQGKNRAHLCLSVFVGKYMSATYTKACEVDFETLGSIKSCLLSQHQPTGQGRARVFWVKTKGCVIVFGTH